MALYDGPALSILAAFSICMQTPRVIRVAVSINITLFQLGWGAVRIGGLILRATLKYLAQSVGYKNLQMNLLRTVKWECYMIVVT